MDVNVFDKSDKDYLDWINRNPNGFVVNNGRGDNSKYFVLHKPSCLSISRIDRTKGAYTQGAYRKICSFNYDELKQWFDICFSKFEGQFKDCSICKGAMNKN